MLIFYLKLRTLLQLALLLTIGLLKLSSKEHFWLFVNKNFTTSPVFSTRESKGIASVKNEEVRRETKKYIPAFRDKTAKNVKVEERELSEF